MSPEEIGRMILDAVKAYVTAQVQPLRESLAAAHARLINMPQPLQGERGEKGEPGPAGDSPSEAALLALITPLIPAPIKGEPGERGEKGERGERGEQGLAPSELFLRELIIPLIPKPLKGAQGEKGDQGLQGLEGKPGKDAARPTQEELRALIVPLIPAPVQGETGPRGERGEQGAAPSADELRTLIIPLIPAPVCGEKGADGKDGRDGDPGRDALALEILPEIDQAHSYPRGSYAKHEGGLWRAFESTQRMRGWECLVEGIAHESEELSPDGRTLVRRTIYSSGREFQREFRFSTVLDRGVYKAEHAYAPGDAVTWAGSIWIAQQVEADRGPPVYGKPGTAGSGWRLAVKAGRDARP